MNKDIINRKAFLFDLDGVLIDTERKYTDIWAGIDRDYPTGAADFAHRIKGTTLESILDTYYPDAELKKKIEKRLYEEEARIKYETTPGCLSLLALLKERGVPAAMVTSSNSKKLKRLWSELPELRQYFTAIIDGDMVTESKPSPEGYLLGAAKVGVAPEDCAVCEDSLQGVKAGKNAGAFVVGIRGTVADELLAPYCDIIVDSPQDILGMLE